MYDFKQIRGHIEVYYNGCFLFSSDDMEEAQQDVEAHKSYILSKQGLDRSGQYE